MQHRYAAALAAAALVLAACADAPPVAPEGAEAAVAPAPVFARSGDAIPGAWIVVFRDDVRDVPGLARGLAARHGGELRYTYGTAIKGMALRNLPEPAIEALRRHPQVAYIEADQPVQLVTTQNDATWGLDRIDQPDGLNGTYVYESIGAGVTAYIIDTGILSSHSQFSGRMLSGYTAISDGRGTTDCNGHGTHVAGTVGGSIHGVAKGVSLVPVRVLDCSGNGSWSGVIAGIDWVTASAAGPAVANMSLGGGASSSVNAAVERSIASGVTYAVAAGNGDRFGRPQDACNYSPASVGAALTVGSTTSSDTESSFSNYGTCVDILAPGSSITSAWYSGNTATRTISGTSMATPHVAGAAALFLEANADATPAQVSSYIVGNATEGAISRHSRSVSGGTPNLLLFVGADGGTTPPPPSNAAPTATFTYSCSGLTCQFTDASTDEDGTIESRSWSFGDGSSTAANPTHTFTSGGTKSVTLTVADDDGATDSFTESFTVTEPTDPPPSGSIELTAVGSKERGNKTVTLSWTQVTSVIVHLNGSPYGSNPVTGSTATYSFGKGGGTYLFRVCQSSDPSNCSDTETVSF